MALLKEAYLPTRDRLVENWLYDEQIVQQIVSEPSRDTLLVFVGGSDIDPALYGQRLHPTMSEPDYARDRMEREWFERSKHNPKFGICRGAQFLNVMNGGSMWQDVDGHLGEHILKDCYTNKQHEVTSTHHQQMIPFMFNSVMVALANESHNKYNEYGLYLPGDKTEDDWDDTEVVWYPRSTSLCFQPHPEYGHKETSDYAYELIERYLCAESLE